MAAGKGGEEAGSYTPSPALVSLSVREMMGQVTKALYLLMEAYLCARDANKEGEGQANNGAGNVGEQVPEVGWQLGRCINDGQQEV